MKLYDVDGYDTPRMLSDEHAELIGATEHIDISAPSRAARKREWIDFAVEQGGDPIELDTLTKSEIVERYGS